MGKAQARVKEWGYYRRFEKDRKCVRIRRECEEANRDREHKKKERKKKINNYSTCRKRSNNAKTEKSR